MNKNGFSGYYEKKELFSYKGKKIKKKENKKTHKHK